MLKMIMNQEKLDEHIKLIEEFVIDEGKIVTYKWLSRKLNLHINTAKQLLHSFLSTRGRSHDTISCNHQVSGIKEDGSLLVSVVSDEQLLEVVGSLTKLLSKHIYSVQKTNEIDGTILYAVDPFDHTSSIKSSITTSLSVLKENLPVVPVEIKPGKVAPKVLTTKIEKKSPIKKTESPKKESPIKKNVLGKKSSPKKENRKTEEKKTSIVVKDPAKDKKQNAISTLFSAQSKKPKVEKKVEQKENIIIDKVVEVNKEEKKEAKSGVKEKKESKKKTKRKVDNEAEKKRKRIRVFSDSEDSDESGKQRSPSPPPCDEVEEPMEVQVDINEEPDVEITKEDDGSKHKKKKRKIIDVLEMTEEGYMETKKKVVYTTDSEDEGENTPKVEVHAEKKKVIKTGPSPKSSTSPKKGRGKTSAAVDGKKQSSLLSFFKKT